MAGNIDGHQFENVLVSAADDAKMINALANNRSFVIAGYEQEMAATVSGLNVTVAAGCSLIQGRFVYIKQAELLRLAANKTGYIAIVIDLNKTVDTVGDPYSDQYNWTNNQVRLEFITSLVDGNLNQNDKVYTFPLYQVTTSGTTATLTKIENSFYIHDTGWKSANAAGSCHYRVIDNVLHVRISAHNVAAALIGTIPLEFTPLRSAIFVINVWTINAKDTLTVQINGLEAASDKGRITILDRNGTAAGLFIRTYLPSMPLER